MKLYKRNRIGKFAKVQYVEETNMWGIKYLIMGFFGILLYAGATSIIHWTVTGVHNFWNGVVSHQVALRDEALMYSAPLGHFVAPEALAEAVEAPVDIEALKDEVADRLMRNEAEGLVIEKGEMKPTFDPPQSMMSRCKQVGGVMPSECLSYGFAQMKLGTIKMWQAQLGMPVMNDMDAIALANNKENTRNFVKQVIFTIPGSIWQWSGATREKKWFQSHIEHIRSLTK